LLNELIGAAFHGADGGLDGAEGGDDDDEAFEAVAAEAFDEIESGFSDEIEVGDDDVELGVARGVPRIADALGFDGGVAVELEALAERRPERRFIFNYQHPGHSSPPWAERSHSAEINRQPPVRSPLTESG